MGLTHFNNGITSFGGVVLPFPGIVPSTTSGQGITPGGVYFVNGDIGNDGYKGTTPTQPFLTLDRAYTACYGGRNEIIYVLGGSAAVSFSSAYPASGAGLVWAKNYTHVIGLSGPNPIGGRARITNGASTVLMTPMIQVSGIGCLFQNLEFENVGSHATSAAVCIAITGVRNSFVNCQISGGVGALNVGAAMRSLLIGGITGGTGTNTADENYFNHCYIGLDTVPRTSTSSEIEILGGSARTVFENCMISTIGTGGNFYLTIGANGIDRFCLFDHCKFLNAYTFRGSTILTDAFAINAAPGGLVILTGGCIVTGATNLSASDTAIFSGDAIPSVSGAKAIAMTW
jgi:hypothetical protein